jgi:hypothetical protein
MIFRIKKSSFKRQLNSIRTSNTSLCGNADEQNNPKPIEGQKTRILTHTLRLLFIAKLRTKKRMHLNECPVMDGRENTQLIEMKCPNFG